MVFAGQSYYVYSAQDTCGAWQKGKIGEKETIFTDRADVYEYMELEVPESGYYQVYLSLYHNWRKCCPFLYCKLIDSKGKSYLNYVFSEPRWYLEEGQGRWEYRCLSAEPYWYLHKGNVKIKFWVQAKKSCWEREDVLMPSSLAVGEFVLIPVDTEEKVHVNLTLP
ncbi:MAG: hypothetical protein KKH34_02910 [Candidatus Omnitrophica bacterium]|nr:hypothetical protein [Candidatus Omnitrophota bacterium]MCG2703633.1 hypothetical protein [Candidatus Omnitrophota bacterium]